MKTRLLVHETGDVVSDIITLVKPRQEITEVQNTLLDGSWHVQVIGDPRLSYDLEFVVLGTKLGAVDSYAALKTMLCLEQYGKTHTGVISGSPDWDKISQSADPAQAWYKCKISLLVW